MTERHDRRVGDGELTAALRSLVDRGGPPDMRVRVEQVLNATPALAVSHTSWRWGYGLVLTVGVFLAVAMLSLLHRDEEPRHAVSPPTPAIEKADGRVPSRAVPFELSPQAANVSPRGTGRPGRAEQPSISARAGATAQPMPEDGLWPEWSPAALVPPTAITAADIGVAPIAVKAPVVTRLQAIEALP